jgi:hypothetical protein
MPHDEISFDEFDELHFPREQTTEFEALTETLLSRRNFVGGSVAFGAAAFVSGSITPPPAGAASRLVLNKSRQTAWIR